MAKKKQLPPWLKQEEAEMPMQNGKKPAPKPKGKGKPKGKPKGK